MVYPHPHTGPGSHPRSVRWWEHRERPGRRGPYRQPRLPMRVPPPPPPSPVMPLHAFAPPPGVVPPHAIAPGFVPPPGPVWGQPTLPGFTATTVHPNPFGGPHFHTNVPPGHYPVPTPYPVLTPPPPLPPAPVVPPAPVPPAGHNGFAAISQRERGIQHAALQTQAHKADLMNNYSTSWVERLFKGAKDFVWNDFGKHPIMSAGAVYLSYLLFKNLKGTRAGTGIAWAAGLSIAYHFMRDKFEIDLVDEAAEKVGMVSPKGEKNVRKFFDTMRRAFTGPEGEGSAIGYFTEKLKPYGNEFNLSFADQSPEKAMLLAFMETPVSEFYSWYADPTRPLPPKARGVYNRLYTPSSLDPKSEPEKSNLMMRVARTVFKYVGNGNEQAGEQSIKSKTLDGSFVAGEVNPLRVAIEHRIAELPSDCAECRQLHEVLTHIQGTVSGSENMIQSASTHLTMLDAMIMDEDNVLEMINYDGIGASFKEIMAGTKHYTGKAVRGIDYYGHKALDGIESGYARLSTYLGKKLEENDLTKEDFKVWYKQDFKPWLIKSKDKGFGMLGDLKRSPVGRLVFSTVNFGRVGLGEGAKITGNALDDLAVGIDGLADSIDSTAENVQST